MAAQLHPASACVNNAAAAKTQLQLGKTAPPRIKLQLDLVLTGR